MKVFVKTVILLFTTQILMAQGIEIGAKGSLNLSNVTKFQLAETILGDSKILSTAGGALFVEIPIGEGFSFRPEVGYARRGSKFSDLNLGDLVNLDGWVGTLLNGAIKPRVSLDYVDVPLMLKYKLGDSEYGSAYVFGGPNLGFKVDDQVVIETMLGEIAPPIDLNFSKFEIGGKVGAGYSFPFKGRAKGFIEASYQRGFNNLVDDVQFVKVKTRSNNFGISAGIAFPLGK